jgi:hypothetical protein
MSKKILGEKINQHLINIYALYFPEKLTGTEFFKFKIKEVEKWI